MSLRVGAMSNMSVFDGDMCSLTAHSLETIIIP
jgi:hypothetical protein